MYVVYVWIYGMNISWQAPKIENQHNIKSISTKEALASYQLTVNKSQEEGMCGMLWHARPRHRVRH